MSQVVFLRMAASSPALRHTLGRSAWNSDSSGVVRRRFLLNGFPGIFPCLQKTPNGQARTIHQRHGDLDPPGFLLPAHAFGRREELLKVGECPGGFDGPQEQINPDRYDAPWHHPRPPAARFFRRTIGTIGLPANCRR